MSEIPVIEFRELVVRFPVRGGVLQRTRGWVHAVNGIDLIVGRGETLALVGESGCGKSTTGLAAMGLVEPTSGEVLLDGVRLTSLSPKASRSARRRLQMVFQDPSSSLNLRMSVGELVGEPLEVHHIGQPNQRRARVIELLDAVGLGADAADRYPHQFSGGQRQRIAIARALAPDPDLIVCDEPIAALDVSVRAQVVNLLVRLQREMGVAFLFISHDLAAVRHLAHRVAVMYLGRVVELVDAAELYERPRHPYTQALLSAVPVPDPDVEQARERLLLTGDVPSPLSPPSGCAFRTRCPVAVAACADEVPTLRDVGAGAPHLVACRLVERDG